MEQNSEIIWVEAAAIYNQNEAQLISGLLTMAGIPVKVERDAAIELYPLNVGPLAKIQIMVPADKVSEAQKILAGNVEDLEIP